MATLTTIPAGSKDTSKRIYIQWYDSITKCSKKKVTKFVNTREGWISARKFLKEFEGKLIAKEHIEGFNLQEDKGLTFTLAFDKFIAIAGYQPKTLEMYFAMKEHWLAIHKDKYLKEYTELEYQEFQQYLREKVNLRTNSISIYTRCLKRFFNWSIEVKLLKQNIAQKVVKQVQKPVEVIPEEHLKIILDELLRRGLKQGFQLILWMYLTGCRCVDSLNMTWDKFNWIDRCFGVWNCKVKRDDILPIGDALLSLLNEIGIKKTGRLFSEYQDKDSLKFFYRVQKDLIKHGNLKVNRHYTLHQLRKSFCTRLIDNHVSLYDTAKLALHKQESTTKKHYIQVDLNRLRGELNRVNNNCSIVSRYIHCKDNEISEGRKSGDNKKTNVNLQTPIPEEVLNCLPINLN